MSNTRIEKQDHFGNGIAKLDSKTIFVEKALPDELVKIELTEEKKNFSKARITEIIEQSPMREIVECKYYNQCGGCHILHQDYLKQLEFKVNKVNEILQRIAHINFKLSSSDIVFKNRYHYRNKIVLHNLGLFQEKSNHSIKINECLLVNEQINSLIKLLSQSKIVQVLEYNKKYLTKKKFITEEIANYRFKISPKSFFQVNYEIMNLMYKYIMDLVKEIKPEKVLDLYCGTGTIGILVSKYARFVEGIEIVEDAIIDANYNKKINEITNINFTCNKVENIIDTFENIDLIIVDPPRIWLDKKTKEHLERIKANKIIYTSCDIATLARDIDDLNNSYKVEKIKIFDMFPNTYHVECVCVLNRL